MKLQNGYVKLLGLQSYASKDKNGNAVINNTLHFCEDFNDYDVQHGALGMKCSSEFTRMELPPTLKPGDLCKLYYAKGFKDLAVLDGIEIFTLSTPTDKK